MDKGHGQRVYRMVVFIASKKLKICFYAILIQPVVLYGSETWTPGKAEQTRLAMFEQKVLRRIYGPCIDAWRVHHNEELESLIGGPEIIAEITRRR